MFDETVQLRSNDIPLYMNKAKISNIPFAECSPMHYHNEVEFLYIIKGSLKCSFNEQSFLLSENDILFINKRIPHNTVSIKEGQYILMQYNPDKLLYKTKNNDAALSFLINSDIPYYLFSCKLSSSDNLRQMMSLLYNAYKDGENLQYIIGYLHLITGLLIDQKLITNPDEIFKNNLIDKIAPAIRYMSENYSEAISVNDLSKIVNINPQYFCRIFKNATGKTCIDFLNNIRVYHAEKLLDTTKKNILEISMETGYSSSSYFNRIFKKIKGYSPSEYRKIKYSNE